MYLISTAEINAALNRANCNGNDGEGESAAGALLMALTRVEEALEVDSLARASYTDIFEVLDVHERSRDFEVRLVNGFLLAGAPISLVAIDGANDPDDPIQPYKVIQDTGMVTYRGLTRGRYRITYTSGFEVDDKNVAIDVPQWMKNLCITMVLHWYRIGVLAPMTGKNTSYRAMIEAAVREIFTRRGARWDRPRYNVIFAARGTYGSN